MALTKRIVRRAHSTITVTVPSALAHIPIIPSPLKTHSLDIQAPTFWSLSGLTCSDAKFRKVKPRKARPDLRTKVLRKAQEGRKVVDWLERWGGEVWIEHYDSDCE